jgi:ATPase subunit of ABC transporter with duplicated ATPase domains
LLTRSSRLLIFDARRKSTLIKMLLGKEEPDSGAITVGETVNMVSVGQERMDELNAEKTVFEEISGGQDELELGTQTVLSRAYLSWFGFKGGSQQSMVGNLSGGERNRVQLAKILKEGGNLIILDGKWCLVTTLCLTTPAATFAWKQRLLRDAPVNHPH